MVSMQTVTITGPGKGKFHIQHYDGPICVTEVDFSAEGEEPCSCGTGIIVHRSGAVQYKETINGSRS